MMDMELCRTEAIARNIGAVKDKIARSAERAGRSAGEITLLAATKTRGYDEIRAAGGSNIGAFRARGRCHRRFDRGQYRRRGQQIRRCAAGNGRFGAAGRRNGGGTSARIDDRSAGGGGCARLFRRDARTV